MQNLVRYYRQLIVENRSWMAFLLSVFLLSVVFGVLISLVNPNTTISLLKDYAGSLDQNVKEGLPLSIYVFTRNASIVLLSSAAGVFLGLPTVATTFFNGLILGVLLGFAPLYRAINPWQLFLLLAPHGIFEYIGSFLALSFGTRLGLEWLTPSAAGKRRQVFIADVKNLLAILPLAIGLLILAALIEGNFTNQIACFGAGICR